MGQKAKNAGKKQSKTCNKPVSSYLEINTPSMKELKKSTSIKSKEDLELFSNNTCYKDNYEELESMCRFGANRNIKRKILSMCASKELQSICIGNN